MISESAPQQARFGTPSILDLAQSRTALSRATIQGTARIDWIANALGFWCVVTSHQGRFTRLLGHDKSPAARERVECETAYEAGY